MLTLFKKKDRLHFFGAQYLHVLVENFATPICMYNGTGCRHKSEQCETF